MQETEAESVLGVAMRSERTAAEASSNEPEFSKGTSITPNSAKSAPSLIRFIASLERE